MGESNTVVSVYTMYRHLQQYCCHPSLLSDQPCQYILHLSYCYDPVIFIPRCVGEVLSVPIANTCMKKKMAQIVWPSPEYSTRNRLQRIHLKQEKSSKKRKADQAILRHITFQWYINQCHEDPISGSRDCKQCPHKGASKSRYYCQKVLCTKISDFHFFTFLDAKFHFTRFVLN